MLKITIPASTLWDEGKEEFIDIRKETNIQLEHSLVSISKWESKYCKSFFKKQKKTKEEILDYIRFMTITQNVPEEAYYALTASNFKEIEKYIEAPMTATVFSANNGGGTREVLTSELIYYWMIALQIPFECQKWHINRLLTLIRVCSIKNTPPKKMSKKELMRRNANLNELRKKQLNTKG